ncbi:RNA binding [Mactra antiquata]
MSEDNHGQITQGGVYQTGTQPNQQYYSHVLQPPVNQSGPVKYQVMIYNAQGDHGNIQRLESLPRGSYPIVRLDNGQLIVDNQGMATTSSEHRSVTPEDEQKGEESQLLLCSETFTSPTPPSDDIGWTQPGPSIIWTHSDKSERESAFRRLGKSLIDNASSSNGILPNLHSRSKIIQNGDSGELLKAALLGDNRHNTSDNHSETLHLKPDINSNFQTKCTEENLKFTGNEVDSSSRMSGPNGFDRHRMTGSSVSGNNNNNISRSSDGSGSQGQGLPQISSTTEGMLLGHIGGTGGVAIHDISSRSITAGTVGAGPQATVGVPVFRPPHTVTDTARYPTAFTTSGASSAVGPYSPVYTPGTHGTGLAPYSAFYNQYPGYSAGVMHGTIDPQLGTYSAVLHSMGTHAAQSQVPRSPYAGAAGSSTVLGQYSMPVPLTTSPSGKTFIGSSNIDRRDADMEKRRYSTGVIKEEKHQFSVPSGFTEPSRVSFPSSLRESPSHTRDPQDYYKSSSGREGSLKHRILRPESVSTVPLSNPQQSAFINPEEPLTKRTKLEHSGLDKDTNQKGSRPPEPGSQTPADLSAGRNPNLHYPPHFQKGSIIQLGNGEYKRVEDLETNDFRVSADVSNDLKIDSSTVVQIEENETHGTAVLGFAVGEHKIQVTVEATVEHPFFVFGQGWSSCEPTWTLKRYGLECHKLSVGDICVSLTHKDVTERAEEISQQQKRQQQQQTKLEGNSFELKTEPSPHHRESPGQGQGQGLRIRSESGQVYGESNTASAKGEHSFGSPVTSHTQEHRSLPSTTS